MSGRVDVVYIGGYPRSGSTLLSCLLGGLPGYVAVGELRELWQKGVLEDQLCSCGESFLGCPFWTEVGARAFGGWAAVDAEELASLGTALMTSDRYLPALLGPRIARGRRATELLRRYTEPAGTLYETIRDVSGAQIVVDSSKLPTAALVLARTPNVRPRAIHLVRDGRGVAFSWAKRGVLRPEVTRRPTYMDTYGYGFTAVRWAYHNGLMHLLPLIGMPRVLLRYESLVRAPRAEIGRVLERFGLPAAAADLEALDDRRLQPATLHTISGNPMRFRGADQPVEVDEAWRAGMPRGARRTVTALTWPLLLGYGYLRPGGNGGSPQRGPSERAA